MASGFALPQNDARYCQRGCRSERRADALFAGASLRLHIGKPDGMTTSAPTAIILSIVMDATLPQSRISKGRAIRNGMKGILYL